MHRTKEIFICSGDFVFTVAECRRKSEDTASKSHDIPAEQKPVLVHKNVEIVILASAEVKELVPQGEKPVTASGEEDIASTSAGVTSAEVKVQPVPASKYEAKWQPVERRKRSLLKHTHVLTVMRVLKRARAEMDVRRRCEVAHGKPVRKYSGSSRPPGIDPMVWSDCTQL
jgi:hypothetical protein